MTRKETYSYLVLKKGPRKEKEWPRIVREVLVRPKHSICRMCTSNGQLQEVIFTASKHGKLVKYYKNNIIKVNIRNLIINNVY